MKKLIVIIILILSTQVNYAQYFNGGLILGVSGSQVDGDEQSGYKKAGIMGGVYVKRILKNRFSILSELYYTGKGAVLNEYYTDGSSMQVFKISLHYIEIPVLADFKISEKFSVSAGIAPSYLISAKLFRNGYEIDTNSYIMKNFDFSPMGQVDFYVTDHLSANIKFSYSAVSIRQDNVWFNNNLNISLRYKF